MGRKTRRRIQTRPKPTLPTSFQCPFCNRLGTLQIKIKKDRENKWESFAEINCTCDAFPESHDVIMKNIRSIDEKVDIHGEFLDLVHRLDSIEDWVEQLERLEFRAKKVKKSRQKIEIEKEEETGTVEEKKEEVIKDKSEDRFDDYL